MNACPCGSGKTLDECCGQYFETLAAPTALVLMRSRYTAHVLGKAQYLHDTLSTKQRVGFEVAEYEAHHGEITWTGLEIRGSSGGGTGHSLGESGGGGAPSTARRGGDGSRTRRPPGGRTGCPEAAGHKGPAAEKGLSRGTPPSGPRRPAVANPIPTT